MTKEEAKTLKPWDIVVLIGKHGNPNQDAIVKKVTDEGVFCVFRIQSTAVLCKFEDIEKL